MALPWLSRFAFSFSPFISRSRAPANPLFYACEFDVDHQGLGPVSFFLGIAGVFTSLLLTALARGDGLNFNPTNQSTKKQASTRKKAGTQGSILGSELSAFQDHKKRGRVLVAILNID